MTARRIGRREFAAVAASTVAAAVLAPLAGCLRAVAPGRQRIPVGIQLYSVRDDCARDLGRTLAGLAKAGYDGVEYAGYHGRDAKALRALQDDLGLRCCGTHTGLDTLLGDEFPRTVEFNLALGNRYLIVPWLDEERRGSKAAWQKTAAVFTELAAKAKPHGLRVGFHAHANEFQVLNGEMPWDIFGAATSPDVILQLDTANCLSSGGDPVAELARWPGRAVTVHLKEWSPKKGDAFIGEGDVPWARLLPLVTGDPATEWMIIEQEEWRLPPVECAARDLENLRRLLSAKA
ncbi:MAG: sugar phosphate isomerase/epimerase [Candidatus Coatesbacteria bacterium]